jgi:hypothetical protein
MHGTGRRSLVAGIRVILVFESDFTAEYPHIARGFDSQADCLALGAEDRNDNVVANPDLLVRLACENQHLCHSIG